MNQELKRLADQQERMQHKNYAENALKKLRKEKNLKQSDLAEILGVTRRTIGRLENYEQPFTLTMASDITEYFKCDIRRLFPDTIPKRIMKGWFR